MIDYKRSGVDIDKSDSFIEDITKMVSAAKRREVIGNIGGFSAFTKIPGKYKKPILVSSTDGVGTKLMVAGLLKMHSTIGIDLVGMCVNDVIVTGAEPLFFLDYFATGKLNKTKAVQIIRGIVKGCIEAGCSLVGGETAEMPGMYKGDDYDLAGFCVGVVEKDRIIDGRTVRSGDRIIGIQSSGLHSNGFSLVRKVFRKSELKGKIGEVLLTPTIIYVKPILKLLEKINIKSMAHITGGGFYDNIPRVLPSGKTAVVYKGLWPVPEIFRVIERRSGLGGKEMYRTFNMGIGMVIIVDKDDAAKAHGIIEKHRLKSWDIGEIIKGKREVVLC